MADWLASGGSIADVIAQASNEVLAENYLPGYTYYESHQAYYNPDTQYFYFPTTGYFYDTKKACYLRYNEVTGRYESVDTKEKPKRGLWSKKRFKRRAMGQLGGRVVYSMEQYAVDATETVYDLVDRVSFLAGDDEESHQRAQRKFGARNSRRWMDDDLDRYMADDSYQQRNRAPRGRGRGRYDRDYVESDGSEPETDDEAETRARRQNEEESAKNAPCLRIIELVNSYRFHIVTIDGAIVGCSHSCTVQLPDEGPIEEEHAQVFFDVLALPGKNEPEPEKCFQIRNLHRQSILVNDTVLTKRKTVELKHGDVIRIGDNRLMIHIHKGMNTCNDCEPGILAKKAEQAEHAGFQPKKSSEFARKQFMNQMKRKYGLDKGLDGPVPEEYFDRAKVRRKVVGSEIDLPPTSASASEDGDSTYKNCAAAPVSNASTASVQLRSQPAKKPSPPPALSESNKGFKLLKGMGWSEGKGLGKAEQGTVDCIATQVKVSRTGLGHETEAAAKPTVAPVSRKAKILQKTWDRFQELDKK